MEYSKEYLLSLIKECKTKSKIYTKFGYTDNPNGRNRQKVKNIFVEYGIDLDKEIENLRRVDKTCPVCDKNFKVIPSNDSITCSYSCSNTYFRSGYDHPNWSGSNYRVTFFLYHKKVCVVCGEDKIIEVHHLDENNENNNPANLIPLCPTHHRYWHSKYKYLVENIILKYVNQWKRDNCSPDQNSQFSV